MSEESGDKLELDLLEVARGYSRALLDCAEMLEFMSKQMVKLMHQYAQMVELISHEVELSELEELADFDELPEIPDVALPHFDTPPDFSAPE